MLTGSSPIFATADVEKSVEFYKEVLGFTSSWMYGDPPTFSGACMNGLTIMFCLQPELAQNVRGHQHSIEVDDVDALYSLHLEKGATIVSPLENKPWGIREYTVEDINGYYLRFGGSVGYVSPGSSDFPDDVRIVKRLPTLEEYRALSLTAFNRDIASGEILEGTWLSVVAEDMSGQAVGMLRVMLDSKGWFSIWDVAVSPEWQHRKIGTKLMEEALIAVREYDPGALVFLFTYKNEFYERLGFKKESVHMLRL